nr:glycosyltransferase [Shewanella gelidimarina]
MPFKYQFSSLFDELLVLSKQAKEYALKYYDFSNISIARLGVDCCLENKDGKSIVEKVNSVNIVSISNCVRVKRVDKIIEAIYLYSKHTNKAIYWTHIGGGDLLKSLSDYSQERFKFCNNVNYKFTGFMEHSSLLKHLKDESYDIVINASESEGVPVTLMEAMMNGIIPVAPNVGGIGDLIPSTSIGFLMSNKIDGEDIASVLVDFEKLNKTEVNLKSKSASQHIFKLYNSKVNYKELYTKTIGKYFD